MGLIFRSTRETQTAFHGLAQIFAYRHERHQSRTKLVCAVHLGRIENGLISYVRYRLPSLSLWLTSQGSELLLALRATIG